jgi:hypothetical protein
MLGTGTFRGLDREEGLLGVVNKLLTTALTTGIRGG